MFLQWIVALLTVPYVATYVDTTDPPVKGLNETNCYRPPLDTTCAILVLDVGSPSKSHISDFKTTADMLQYADCVLDYLNLKKYVVAYRRRNNMTEDQELPYYITDGSRHLPNLLSTPPVPEKSDKFLNVQITGSHVAKITEDYQKQEMNVMAYTFIAWNDTRVKWADLTCFKVKKFSFYEDKLNSNEFRDNAKMIWRPNFHKQTDLTYRWVYLFIDGNHGIIRGVVRSESIMRCYYNYIRYPFDTVDCHLYMSIHSPSVRLVSEVPKNFTFDYNEYKSKIRTPPDRIVVDISERSVQDMNTIITRPKVDLLVRLKRKSQLPYTITVMMLAISATSGMFGPLTGNINGLKFTKLLSIATSVAGVMILALHNPKLYHSAVTPHIFVAFEFLMAVSLLSLLLSLTQYHLMGSITGKLPPPHKVKLISNLLNLGLFGIPKLFATDKEENGDNAEVIGNCEIQPKKSYTIEWLEIGNSLHRLLFLIFFFIYFIGIISLCNF